MRGSDRRSGAPTIDREGVRGLQAVFLDGEQGHARIYVPSIVLAELYYLNVKYNQPLVFAQECERLTESGQFYFVEFRAADVLRFDVLAAIPEMHDRIIAGLARRLEAPILTSDRAITASGIVEVVWM